MILRLAAPTRSSWIDEVRADLPALLIDHANCEKKAASTVLNLLFRYTDPDLANALSPVAREELEHFELVLSLLKARGIPFVRLSPSTYAKHLYEAVRREEPDRLLDTLLCCALIEARSCERMQILSEGLDDPDLRAVYKSLLASEARHHQLYVRLATDRFDKAVVHSRLVALAAHEAKVLSVPGAEPRVHS